MSEREAIEVSRGEVFLAWLRSEPGAVCLILLTVFLACLLGIYTRPVGFLASIWPANALLLGLLLRLPRAAKPLGWLAGAVAYMLADLLTGSSLFKAAILNFANLVSVGIGYAILARLPPEMIRLRRPASVFHLLTASAAAGAGAGLVGGFANPILFNSGVLSGWTFWFSTELVNHLAFLPVVLSVTPFQVGRLFDGPLLRRGDLLPAVVLFLSGFVAVLVGGPGAIAFPVPALLWCGLVYPVFPTAVMTLMFGIWAMAVISVGYIPSLAIPKGEMALVSIRLGASLIALAPIMLASVMQSRNELLGKLHDLATRDPLTGADNRRAFLESAQEMMLKGRLPLAVLMLDIDHFKAVNDHYGHAGGDAVLVEITRRTRDCLRTGDLFGRLGGEEFAIFVPDCSQTVALQVAERIRQEVARVPVALQDGRSVPVTTSIGMVLVTAAGVTGLDGLLAEADAALYLAKHNGRNRLETRILGVTGS
ncbi:sensor domain-containing diguanylate cyclase [Stagnimonas aquatica]|uniref:diguanylate cyclase n=1 Tax=Stagnimonas aquatica TaxID=2689987 RepID=A0A3N0V8X0_9GAMM|nr:GGDEF domain-containing protein [Stagnimonas aquatica]ROH89064.1 sensor domain-containing diguanylate cyclase [Stagnimonas aquatica]